MVTVHFLNLTDSEPDSTWDGTDYGTVETAFSQLWTDIKDNYFSWLHLDQFRWYRDGPAFHPTPSEGNPADRVTEVDVAGSLTTGTTNLPPQVAISVTERTAIRKRWGRFYLPAPRVSQTTIEGRLQAAFVDEIADACEAAFNTCRAADLIPVVFSPTTENAYSVDELQVDDLFDVIRSRRWSGPTIRDRRTLVAI